MSSRLMGWIQMKSHSFYPGLGEAFGQSVTYPLIYCLRKLAVSLDLGVVLFPLTVVQLLREKGNNLKWVVLTLAWFSSWRAERSLSGSI